VIDAHGQAAAKAGETNHVNAASAFLTLTTPPTTHDPMVTTRRTPGTPAAARANASTGLPKPAKARVAAPVADVQSVCRARDND
jgi:hypothetical protein